MTTEISKQMAELSFASENYDPAKYEGVARNAYVREVRLAENNYTANISSFLAVEYGDQVDFRQSFSGKPTSYDFSSERGVLAGTYHWSAEVKHGRSKVLKLNTEYVVVYSNLKDAPEDYVRLYFNKIARFTTYPYFRAHFAVQVAASGVMLAPLPSLFDRVD
jgi:hypothetical protein